MWKSIFVATVVALLLLAACNSTPALVVQPEQVDLGDIAPDAPVSTTIQIHNSGAGTLHIAGVRTSCGCTTAQLSRTSLAGGEQADLSITFDPQAHAGLYGRLLRIVYLQSNDPAHSELEIPVTVTVLEPQEVIP